MWTLKKVNDRALKSIMDMIKIELGIFTCSTKFGGSVIESTPVGDRKPYNQIIVRD